MKPKYSLRACLVAAGLLSVQAIAFGQSELLWSGTTGSLFDATKWSPSQVPGLADVVIINNAGTATIAADAGERALSGIKLGDGGASSGHIIMNGGTLTLGGNSGDPKAVIGLSTTLSTFIMNGGTIFFDGPDQFPGSYGDDGLNGLDWEVGEKGLGRFEMHGDAKFYAGDDLKVGANTAGRGSVLIDGNAHFAAGSGISVSEGGPSEEQLLVIGGNAVVDAGNSMGAGNPLGSTDEGYLTMASGGSTGRLIVQENGVINYRRLSAREGSSTIIVKDRGQMHIFDLLAGKGALGDAPSEDRPAETGPNSTLCSAATAEGTITLQDDAIMTVNSDPLNGPTKGLGISAPRDQGNAGGKAALIIRDRASFRVEQNLEVGTGSAESSDGTVTVIGPSAKVYIGGDLKLAADLDGFPTPGKATVNPVITAATQSTIRIAGTAKLAYGTLKVNLDGYTPVGGESYTLVSAAALEGEFANVDLTEAVLGAGLTWKLEYAADAVRLKVEGGAPAQTAPGLAEANGLTPLGPTVYVNPPATTQNNGKVESLGVGVIANGNVVVGWEDDGEGLADQEAVWTLYSPTGQPLTPVTTMTSIDPDYAGQTFSSSFLSYFRADGSAVSGRTSWGPKIKANLFGSGFGMGGTAFDLGKEVVALAAINNTSAGDNAGDFPAVQLLDNGGSPLGILSGLSEPYAERDGDVRIGDWDYLANGNVVIVGESRQRPDLVDVYGGAEPKTHGILRVVKADGSVVKAEQLLGKDPIEVQIWHGSAVTANGFVVRYSANPGGAKLQRFDNDGNKVGDEIDLATLVGSPIASGGGRGEEVGLHGNGKDAYVLAVKGTDADGNPQILVTVLNADCTVRWSRNLGDVKSLAHVAIGRVDAAIDESGRVAVVYADKAATAAAQGFAPLILGRLFDAQGNAIGDVFSVSEKELPSAEALDSTDPRVDWRGNTLAVAWESKNLLTDNPDGKSVVALRTFNVPGGVVTAPTISAVANADGSLTLTYSGTLISSDSVNGTYAPVAGASSPFTVTPAAAAGVRFYRSQN